MTPEQAARIADLLEDDAEMLRAGYVVGGYWPVEPMADQARKDHRELIELAAAVRALA